MRADVKGTVRLRANLDESFCLVAWVRVFIIATFPQATSPLKFSMPALTLYRHSKMYASCRSSLLVYGEIEETF